MLTDQRRVEFALPAALAFKVVTDGLVLAEGAGSAEREQAERLRALVNAACFEPLGGLGRADQAKIARRIGRAVDAALRFLDNPPTDKLGLVLFYLLEDLIERSALELLEGSTFAEAMALLLPALDHAFAEPAFAASARKQARRLAAHLGSLGLYT